MYRQQDSTVFCAYEESIAVPICANLWPPNYLPIDGNQRDLPCVHALSRLSLMHVLPNYS